GAKDNDTTCYYILCWDTGNYCHSDKDYQDAVNISASLKLPLKKLDLRDEYKSWVFEKFIQDYKNGLTPNPDVLCNSKIKFGSMIRSELKDGYIVTGHYASIFSIPDSIRNRFKHDVRNLIAIPKDLKKDQTYFLADIFDSPIIDRIKFPLGNLLKSEVRRIAQDNSLNVYKKKDSQGICFIGDISMRKFLSTYIEPNPGNIISLNSEGLGRHNGLFNYTIGQRKGLESIKNAGVPMYVVEKRVSDNTLVVGCREDCMAPSLELLDFKHVLRDSEVLLGLLDEEMYIRVRSSGELTGIKSLTYISENKVKITLKQPIFAPAPGQYGVLYWNQCIIGRGVIC
ncbi:MAG: tRNA-uridine 2-sulfurtransferase, partial [Patescibacteria group bacterium]|nr:tRNA-uridine 2-sulfurtransferase [Patescibacteria group bacterium]